MNKQSYEECFICGELTGRAGICDDSVYCEHCELGPFCEDCFEEHQQGTSEIKCITRTILVYRGEEYELK